MLTTSSLRSSQLHLDCTPTKGTLEQASGLFAKEKRNELREGRKPNKWAEKNNNTTRTSACSKCETAPRPPHAEKWDKKKQPKKRFTQHSCAHRQYQSFDSSSSPDVSHSMDGGPGGTSVKALREQFFPVAAGGGASRHSPTDFLEFWLTHFLYAFIFEDLPAMHQIFFFMTAAPMLPWLRLSLGQTITSRTICEPLLYDPVPFGSIISPVFRSPGSPSVIASSFTPALISAEPHVPIKTEFNLLPIISMLASSVLGIHWLASSVWSTSLWLADVGGAFVVATGGSISTGGLFTRAALAGTDLGKCSCVPSSALLSSSFCREMSDHFGATPCPILR